MSIGMIRRVASKKGRYTLLTESHGYISYVTNTDIMRHILFLTVPYLTSI